MFLCEDSGTGCISQRAWFFNERGAVSNLIVWRCEVCSIQFHLRTYWARKPSCYRIEFYHQSPKAWYTQYIYSALKNR